MTICYLNGEYISTEKAQVSVFDRGFLFSDGVYEVSLVLDGKLIDNRGHLARLERSLEKIGIPQTLSSDDIIAIQQQLIEKNQMQHGGLYLQITRGSDGDRDFLPSANMQPTVLIIPQIKDLIDIPQAKTGISVMTVPEIRWAKRDIKTVGLLGAVLAKQAAKDNGFDDAWFVENHFVTEGSANNAFYIKGNELVTKAPNHQILNGITRQSIMRLADAFKLTVVERDFTVAEAQAADEVFVTSATMLVVPVVKIDEVNIGDGKPGEKSLAIREFYIEQARANALP